jgi:hypothetical protein
MATDRWLHAREAAIRAPPRHRPARELWTQFDAAVEQLNAAGGGDSLADVVAAYSAVANAGRALADALEAAGEEQTP